VCSKQKCYVVSGMVKGVDEKIEFVQSALTSRKDVPYIKEFFKKSVEASGLILIGHVYVLEIEEHQLKDMYQSVCIKNMTENPENEDNILYVDFGKKHTQQPS